MELEKQERINYIDIARAFAIFLVVLGHTLTSGRIRTAVYAFHMPLFFIISGMLLKRKDAEFTEEDLLKVLKKRTFSYYIPYLVWGLFYSALSMDTLIKILYGTRKMLDQVKTLTSLWFLPTLLVASVISEIVLFSIKKIHNHIAGVAGFCILFFAVGFGLPRISPYGYPMNFNVGCVAAGFMLLGYLLKNINIFCYRSVGSCAVITLISILFFIVVFHFLPPTIGKVAMYEGGYGNIPIFMANALMGSFSVISLACLFDRIFTTNMLLNLVGKNTMGILVIHKPIVEYGDKIVTAWGLSNNDIHVALVITVIGCILSLFLTIIITRIVPELLGKG